MSDKTVINTFGYKLKTVINNNDIDNNNIPNLLGRTLLNRYRIENKLTGNSGEADLYLATDIEISNKVIIKLYRRKNAVKNEVLKKLSSINNKYIAQIIAYDNIDEYPFIVMPYYKNGNLNNLIVNGVKFSLDELKTLIIPSVNEALKTIHDLGIIHKDLKPSNMMISDDESHIVLIDFGISSVVSDNTVVVTQTGKSPFYSAPETTTGLFLAESDYYSFGITLYELFTGYTPFQNVNIDDISRYAMIQKIPFPKDFPSELKNLILGLTFKDISNRNIKDNPNRRWTYNELENWIKTDGKFVLNSSEDKKQFFYVYNLKKYTSIESLVEQLLFNPKEGKKEFARGLLSKKFRQNGYEEIARTCEDAEFSLPNCKNDKESDTLFFNLIYTIAPNYKKLCWDGLVFNSIKDYGNKLLEEVILNNGENKKLINSAYEFLKNKFLSIYSQFCEVNNDIYQNIISINCKLLRIKEVGSVLQALRLGHSLTGRQDFKIDNTIYSSIAEFNNFISAMYNDNLQDYSDYFIKNLSDLNELKKIFAPKEIAELEKNFPTIDNLIILAKGKYYFKSVTDFVFYAKNLEAKELIKFNREISDDIENFKKEDFSEKSLNELQEYQNSIQQMIVIDDNFIFKNYRECLKYANNLRDSNELLKFYNFNKQLDDLLSKESGNNVYLDYFKKSLSSPYTIDPLSGQNVEKIGIIEKYSNYVDNLFYVNDRYIFKDLNQFFNFVKQCYISDGKNGFFEGIKYQLFEKNKNEIIYSPELLNFFSDFKSVNDMKKAFKGLKSDLQKFFIDELHKYYESVQLIPLTKGEKVELGINPYTHEPIQWIVLDVEKDQKVLLLSCNAIACKNFNEGGSACTWETSSLRKWLNSDFLRNSFSENEKKIILSSSLFNYDNPDKENYISFIRKSHEESLKRLEESNANRIDYESNTIAGNLTAIFNSLTKVDKDQEYEERRNYRIKWHEEQLQELESANSGNPTEDKIFILSINEVHRYLQKELRKCSLPSFRLSKKFLVKDEYGMCDWWLRTIGYYQTWVSYVDSKGKIDFGGKRNAMSEYDYESGENHSCAVRVAMWVDIT
ncbi:protein kinase [Ruminobacter sp. RM87]|uniref:protein kinase domain-containing protein n=1 Tax=Ruminobacter sp. RM87 TaxID=1200567 RepID=UPI0004E256FF|nr:protein kinase [Ruminobacter sp. RM87]